MVALDVLGTIIPKCWAILSFDVPGLGVSCQTFLVALLLIGISIAAVHYVFGLGGSGSGYRSGGNGKWNISEKRKGDEK